MRNYFGLALAVIGLLAGCGGGGGSAASTPAFQASFSPALLSVTALSGVASQVSVTTTVTGGASGNASGNLYARLVLDKPNFDPASVAVTNLGNGSFSATLKTDRSLAPGSYSGAMTLHLCNDAACSSEQTVVGNTLPYQITVQTMQASFGTAPLAWNSVAGDDAGTPFNVSITPPPPAGAVVSVLASSPIFNQSGIGPSSSVTLVQSLTPTVFTTNNLLGDPARIYSPKLASGLQSGSLTLQVQCTTSPCASLGANYTLVGASASYSLNVTSLMPTLTQNGVNRPVAGSGPLLSASAQSQVAFTLAMPVPVTWEYQTALAPGTANQLVYCCTSPNSLTVAFPNPYVADTFKATPTEAFLPNTGLHPYTVSIYVNAF